MNTICRAEADAAVVLLASSVCLGRTPGFKRHDVDRAIRISSFEAA